MSHPYNTWAAGTKFAPTYCQEWADALGAINNVAFHPEQMPSYIVFKSGSTYYTRNGSDGTIESSGTSSSSSTVINWAIDQLANRGGTVTLKGPITLDGMITVDQHGVVLEGDSVWCGYSSCESAGGNFYNGLYLADNTNTDMIYVTKKACAIRNIFLDGNSSNQTAGSGIKVNYAGGYADTHLSNVYVMYCKEHGMELADTCYADRCFSEFNTQHGWSITGGYGRYVACTGTSNTLDGWNITAAQNRLLGCTASTNDGDGVEVNDTTTTILDGLMVYNNDLHGIHLVGGQKIVVDGCVLTQNGQATDDTYGQIYLESTGGATHCLYNVITNNVTNEPGANQCKYGIWEADANQDFNVIHDNRLAAPATNYVSLLGTNDELMTVSEPFIYGSAYDDQGWDIDLGAEYATAFFTLPSDVTQVIRLYIYAYSVATETDAMRLQIDINGGATNEAYNTHSYAGTDVPSTETNFTAGDLIYWRVTDSAVLALQRFDSVTVKVTYEDAGGDDCATDARFRNVYVEYV